MLFRSTVFDSMDELLKLSKIPNQKFELLLRIATDDKDSICKFSNKFGANPKDAEKFVKSLPQGYIHHPCSAELNSFMLLSTPSL